MILGCIADDFTGATDLASTLARGGWRVVQTVGVPADDEPVDADAIVVALKSRTVAADEAVRLSLHAARWLRGQGARQLYFKVCSTFDSTPAGNIGPVAEALAGFAGADLVPVTPAFPENGRTVFFGHLFVGDRLLSESGMRHHPLTPMTDPDLVRVLQAQSRGRVGLVDHRSVARGAAAVRARLEALCAEGIRLAVLDAIADRDLLTLAEALRDEPLLVGASGLALGLPAQHGARPGAASMRLPSPRGAAAVISGSCSVATRAQLARAAATLPVWRLDASSLVPGEAAAAAAALAWARPRLAGGPVVIASTAGPEEVAALQARLGPDAGARIESVLAAVARGLVEAGVGRLVVAGGETSGAVVGALGLSRLAIGPPIDPGVPWCHATGGAAGSGLHLALKSGNFGGDDFVARAFAMLDAGEAG